MTIGKIVSITLLAACFSATAFANSSEMVNSNHANPSSQMTSNSTSQNPSAGNSSIMRTAMQTPNNHEMSATSQAMQHGKNNYDALIHKQGSKSAKDSSTPININTATVAELKTLKGVGEKKAEEILKYRQDNGNFASIDDLTKVKGINQNLINKNRDRLITQSNTEKLT